MLSFDFLDQCLCGIEPLSNIICSYRLAHQLQVLSLDLVRIMSVLLSSLAWLWLWEEFFWEYHILCTKRNLKNQRLKLKIYIDVNLCILNALKETLKSVALCFVLLN